MTIKGCVQRNPIYGKDFHFQQESNSAPLDQQASSLPAELLGGLSENNYAIREAGRGKVGGGGNTQPGYFFFPTSLFVSVQPASFSARNR